MDHIDIFAKFLEMFPSFHSQILDYTPVGSNTIKMTFCESQTLIFTYYTDKKWSLIVDE